MTYSNAFYSFNNDDIEFCQIEAEESLFSSKAADSDTDSLLDDSFPTTDEMLEMLDEKKTKIELEDLFTLCIHMDDGCFEDEKGEPFLSTPSIAMVFEGDPSFEDTTLSYDPTDDEIGEMILALSQRIKKNQDDLKAIGDRLGKVTDQFLEQAHSDLALDHIA